MSVEASIVVEFGEGVSSDVLLVAELDEASNLAPDGSGKSSFVPGDEVFFLIHHEPGLVVASITATSGQVTPMGEVTRSKKDRQLFTGDDSQITLPYIPASAVSATWFGNKGIDYKADGRVVSVAGGAPCLCDAAYNVRFKRYKYTPPALALLPDQEWPVSIVIHAEAA